MSTDRRHHCEWSLEQIHALLDGDLDPSLEVSLRNHIDQCAECRSHADAAAEAMLALRQLPSLPCPDPLLGSIRERVRRSATEQALPVVRPTAAAPWASPLGWGLLAVAAAVIFMFVYRPKPDPTPALSVPINTPRIVSTEELVQAEREVKVAFALFRAVGERSATLATEEVLEQGVLAPARKLSLALLGSRIVPKRDAARNP